MFKKILFATDNSEHSNKALPHLESFARNNSEIIVMNSYYIPDHLKNGEHNHYIDVDKMEKHMIDHGNKVLEEIKNKLKEKNIPAKFILSSGEASSAIVNTAVTEGCDLIIIGTRGLGNISNPLISTVSNYVVHHAKCSVLMIN